MLICCFKRVKNKPTNKPIEAVVDQQLQCSAGKILFLVKESGGFEEGDITASVPRRKGLSYGKLK